MTTTRWTRQDRSAVSLTGRYTGQVWVERGLAPKAFGTLTGRWMHRLLDPLNRLADRIQGVSLETMLLQRHQMIDDIVRDFLVQHPNGQVLEIAAGLANRAQRLLKEMPTAPITYLEADLPAVVSLKQKLYRSTGFSDVRHHLTPCNILREQGPLSPEGLLEGMDQGRPVLIINEGLVNYFGRATMDIYWRRMARAMAPFPVGMYVADIWPRLPDLDSLPVRQWAISGIELLTRQSVPLHFQDDTDMAAGFRTLGFHQVRVLDPDRFAFPGSIPTMRQPSLFRILVASTL